MGVIGADARPLTIWCDQNVTRRKWYHILADAEDNHIYHSRRIADCIKAAQADGATSLSLRLPTGTVWSINEAPDPTQEP